MIRTLRVVGVALVLSGLALVTAPVTHAAAPPFQLYLPIPIVRVSPGATGRRDLLVKRGKRTIRRAGVIRAG